MAKPFKDATKISVILSVIAGVGIILGLVTGYPLIPALLLVPTVAYEVYRTEGKSTTASSWLLLAVLILEIVFLVFKISINLVDYLGVEEKLIAGYEVPLGDVKVVAPTVMAILSVILFTRTYGKYTKWLSVIIFITSFAIIYLLDHKGLTIPNHL
ncbi:hypothetical protein JW978_04390 [Candidatus Dojkabacteria bacterium]|nr:hypothetical protein [Candidatus Dojkabacteria bacterium]